MGTEEEQKGSKGQLRRTSTVVCNMRVTGPSCVANQEAESGVAACSR